MRHNRSKDMEEARVKQHLWLHQDPMKGANFLKPHAPYVFTWEEQHKFLSFVGKIRTSTRYVVTFKKHVAPNKLFMMKNHDHHVMLQTIILASIWDLLHLRPRKSLMHLGKTFQKLRTKVLNPTNIQNLRTYVVETLCMLEIWWPLGFFDLQTHFINHLVNELEICGLVGSRWCYPIEWYLHVLKKNVKNKVNLQVAWHQGTCIMKH